MSARRPLVSALACLLALAAPLAAAPDSVLLGQGVIVRQDSASAALVTVEASFAAGVDFAAKVSGVSVTVTPPGRAAVAVPADTASSFFVEPTFTTEAERDAAFPDGRYTFAVSGAPGGTFALDTLAQKPTPARVTNFDAFYLFEPGTPGRLALSWTGPGSPTAGVSFAQVEIQDLQGRVVAHSPDLGEPGALSGGYSNYFLDGLPAAEEYVGEITVAFFSFTQLGSTSLVSARSATTRFPIRRPDTTPPRLVTVSPATGGTLGSGTGPITLTFDEPMNQAGAFFSPFFRALSPDTGTFVQPTIQPTWSADGQAVTLRFTPALPTGLYELNLVSQLRDVAGNLLRDTPTAQFYVGTPRPWISGLPQGGLTAQGAPVFFTVAAKGPGLAYQWQRDGRDMLGATGPVWRLPLADWLPGPAPVFTVAVSNSAGRITGTATPFSLQPSDYPRLVNLSVRNRAGAGAQALITGFAVAGLAPTTRVLLRAIGPGLAPFGVAGVLPDPQLRVQPAGGGPVTVADDWNGNPALVAEAAQVGAFALPAPAKDAVVLLTVAVGGHTATVVAADGREGIALAEVYQTANEQLLPLASRLVNLSARAFAGTGADTLIAGFTIQGRLKKNLLIRAVGPGLAPFGVAGLLADPQLKIYRAGDPAPVDQNDNWETQPADTPPLAAVAQSVGAFALPAGSRDAALLVLLGAGSYTVHLTGVAGATGIALVEIYEL